MKCPSYHIQSRGCDTHMTPLVKFTLNLWLWWFLLTCSTVKLLFFTYETLPFESESIGLHHPQVGEGRTRLCLQEETLIFLSLFIYFEEGEGQRDRKRENPKSREIMIWVEIKSHLTDWATQAPQPWLFIFLLKKIFFIVYSFFNRNRAWVGEGQRERETQNLKQAPGSGLTAQSPTWGSNPRTVRSWPELESDA